MRPENDSGHQAQSKSLVFTERLVGISVRTGGASSVAVPDQLHFSHLYNSITYFK